MCNACYHKACMLCHQRETASWSFCCTVHPGTGFVQRQHSHTSCYCDADLKITNVPVQNKHVFWAHDFYYAAAMYYHAFFFSCADLCVPSGFTALTILRTLIVFSCGDLCAPIGVTALNHFAHVGFHITSLCLCTLTT